MKKCLICKVTLKGKPFWIKRAKYCSHKCYWTTLRGNPPKYIDNTGKRNSPETEIKKGQIPWNKGLKGNRFSPKTEFKKGHIPWSKLNPDYLDGDKHWNWQGGKTSDNLRIRGGREYREWRKDVFKRDDWTCQVCKTRGGFLHSHHIMAFAKFPELRTDLNNGQTLCKSCHMSL